MIARNFQKVKSFLTKKRAIIKKLTIILMEYGAFATNFGKHQGFS
jgi:hypothetical protein